MEDYQQRHQEYNQQESPQQLYQPVQQSFQGTHMN